jgi:hypothetical protein
MLLDFGHTGGRFLVQEKIRTMYVNRTIRRDSGQVALQTGIGQRYCLGGGIRVNGYEDYVHGASFPMTDTNQTQGVIP